MWLLKWLISSLAIMLIGWLIPGVVIASFWTALWLVVLLGLINITLKPLLIVLTLPINVLTLGLFTFIINAVLIMFASSIVKGFSVSGFLTALLFSLILSLFNYIISILFKNRKEV
ncbi:MAG: phage holin family protein [bacterium]